MKRLAQITLTAGVTLLVFVLLWVFQPTLAMFGGSLAISAALRPLVQRLESRGVRGERVGEAPQERLGGGRWHSGGRRGAAGRGFYRATATATPPL